MGKVHTKTYESYRTEEDVIIYHFRLPDFTTSSRMEFRRGVHQRDRIGRSLRQ